MENKKIKKQRKNDKEMLVIIIIAIIIILAIFLVAKNFKGKQDIQIPVSQLELKMLGEYVDKIDFDLLSSYNRFDTESKIDYALKKYLTENKGLKELSLDDFIRYYNTIIVNDEGLDAIKLDRQYSGVLINNAVIYNPSTGIYMIMEEASSITPNAQEKQIASKRIVEKAYKSGNTYSLHIKKIILSDVEKAKQYLLSNNIGDVDVLNMADVKGILSYIDLTNYIAAGATLNSEIVQLDLEDIDNFKLGKYMNIIETLNR